MLQLCKFFVLGVLLFSLGCRSNKDSSTKQKALNLVGAEIKMEKVVEPGIFELYDNLLFMRRDYESEKVLRIVDLEDFSVVSDVIRRGRGPGEVANFAIGVFDDESGIYWLTDWGKNCIHQFYLDSLISFPGYKATSSFPLNPSWIPTMNMFYHPSGHIGFTSVMLQKNLISFMNLNGELVDSLAIPNKIYPDIWEGGGYSDNPLLCKYIPEKNKIIVASRHENKISVINMDGTPVFSKKDFPQYSEKIHAGSWDVAFYSIVADITYIYLVYAGRNMAQYDAESGRNIIHYPNRVIVIDWDGNFQYDLSLDHPTMVVELDKTQMRLIGMTKDFDNYLVSYDLSELYKGNTSN